MIFNLKRFGASGLPVIAFDGDMLSAFSGDEWEAAFLESGTVRFNSNPGDCDIFLVADGESGGETAIVEAAINEYYIYGAGGGRGGNWLLFRATLQAGVDYALAVGATTTFSGGGISLTTANGNQGKAGGARGIAHRKELGSVTGDIQQQPGKGTDGIFAYNDTEDTLIISELAGKRFSAGGAGGDAFSSSIRLYASSNNVGGETDGGDGSRYRNGEITEATPGGAHTGSGGGGARRSYEGFDTISAAGGSGICLIRRHRGA